MELCFFDMDYNPASKAKRRSLTSWNQPKVLRFREHVLIEYELKL